MRRKKTVIEVIRTITQDIGYILIGFSLIYVGACLVLMGILGGDFSMHINNPWR